jgi:hypothetical protein
VDFGDMAMTRLSRKKFLWEKSTHFALQFYGAVLCYLAHQVHSIFHQANKGWNLAFSLLVGHGSRPSVRNRSTDSTV